MGNACGERTGGAAFLTNQTNDEVSQRVDRSPTRKEGHRSVQTTKVVLKQPMNREEQSSKRRLKDMRSVVFRGSKDHEATGKRTSWQIQA
jgi:hypothetical protein